MQWSHPLLNASIAASDVHVADPAWPKQPAPNRAHGTEMAGLALYGDLEAAISGKHPVHLQHRLESVKILPDQGRNEPDSYGALTARAVESYRNRATRSPAGVHARHHRAQRALGAEPLRDAGRPTAWSATVDALAYGRAIDDTDPTFTYLDRDEPRHPRLLIISAGNIPTPDLRPLDDHLEHCDTEPVEDPAQAWNTLTVGAYSARDDMVDAPAVFAGWVPMAPLGELSPVSRTSVPFDRAKWPVKPDVVADGGNVARSPDGTLADTPANLALLTTRLQPTFGGAGLFAHHHEGSFRSDRSSGSHRGRHLGDLPIVASRDRAGARRSLCRVDGGHDRPVSCRREQEGPRGALPSLRDGGSEPRPGTEERCRRCHPRQRGYDPSLRAEGTVQRWQGWGDASAPAALAAG